MRGNTLSMGDMKCISRKRNQKQLNICLTKPFKDASAELRMLLQPLSLFPADKKYLIKEKKQEKTGDYSNDHFKHGLVECIEKQLQWKQEIQDLSPEEQQELINVLLQEVAKIEPYIKEQINNPSLNESQQKKLGSTLHHIVLQICDKLFLYYCDKARVLTARGIFSGNANICRLRTQLTMDAEKILTVQGVKRVFINMKDSTMEDSIEITDDGIRIVQRRVDSGMSSEISEIIKQMPSINLEGLLPACLYTLSQANKQSRSPVTQTPTDRSIADDLTGSFQIDGFEPVSIIRRCNSLPNLFYGDTIWDELELETPTLQRRHSLGNQHFSDFMSIFDLETQDELNSGSMVQSSKAKSMIHQDLLTLLRNRKDDLDLESILSDDMPPLIKAVPQDEKRKRAREKLEKQIQELYEKEKEYQEMSNYDFVEPVFEQPTVVTKKLSVQTAVARTTDVRVSKRTKFVNHHLICKPPQYNDLLGEIDSDGVKELDLPLFEDQKLNEVYEQFLESMGQTDKYFDPDIIFKEVPPGLEIYGERELLNKSLTQFDHPPWGEENYHDWLLQPKKMRVLINATKIYPRIPDLTPVNKNDNRDMIYWKQWWKSFVTPEDYIKYLCITDSDFLASVFHLYESEDKIPEGSENIQEETTDLGVPTKSKKDPVKKGEDETLNEASPEPIDIHTFQPRLDKLWNALQLPEDERIQLAIKYATTEDPQQFEMKLDAWEKAAEFIIRRETLMASLMTFESEASDPNRFFVRGPGNANHRLQEAKTRSMLYNKIESLGKKISRVVNSIFKKFEEVVSFQGRSYLEKMKSDRIEMLHWLQEVRKMNAIHYESKKLHTQLPVLSFKQLILAETFINK